MGISRCGYLIAVTPPFECDVDTALRCYAPNKDVNRQYDRNPNYQENKQDTDQFGTGSLESLDHKIPHAVAHGFSSGCVQHIPKPVKAQVLDTYMAHQ